MSASVGMNGEISEKLGVNVEWVCDITMAVQYLYK